MSLKSFVVNKSLIKPINKNLNKYRQKKIVTKSTPGVTIITVTHLDTFQQNIFDNFRRQIYKKLELLIFINNKEMNMSSWKEKFKYYKNVKIIDASHLSVGSCVNYGVHISKFRYIAIFDHDDYYGSKYISDTVKYANKTNAGLIGKRTHYVYFEGLKTLALRNPSNEHRYVSMIDGPTMFFKKEIFNKVRFIDGLDAADVIFSKDCRKKGIKIYSTNRFHHVYIRRSHKKGHGWKISDEDLLKKYCTVVAKTVDFKNYIDV